MTTLTKTKYTTMTPLTTDGWKRNLLEFRKFSSTLFPLKSSVKLDNLAIFLHSTVTVQILLISTMFLSMKQYFGDPIDCMTSGSSSDIKTSLIEHYCWLEGSFSYVEPSKIPSSYPGVRPSHHGIDDTRSHHKYYQWVYFILLIQAILFYLPKFLWRSTENGRLSSLITRLSNKSVQEFSEADKIKIVQDVADNLSISSQYLSTILFCEIYCFIHLLLQIWFTNMFLGGSFYNLGWKWFSYTHSEYLDDPLVRVFPRLVKCSFHRYGFTGTIEVKDALCFLPLNIVNEKIYAALWVWFMALTVITCIHICWLLALVFIWPLRWIRMNALAPGINKQFVRSLCQNASSWFLLKLLASHVKPSYFRDLINIVEKDHYDKNCKPLYVSRFGEALNRKLIERNQITPSKPLYTTSTSNNRNQFQSKSILKPSTFKKTSSFTKIECNPSPTAPPDETYNDDDWNVNETTSLTQNYPTYGIPCNDNNDNPDNDNNKTDDWPENSKGSSWALNWPDKPAEEVEWPA